MRKLLRPLAALLLAIPCYAQSRDSVIRAGAAKVKASNDAVALTVFPGLAQYCRSPIGYMKQPCRSYSSLLRLSQAGDSMVMAGLAMPNVGRVDTLRLAGKTDTVRVTNTVTLHDTVKVTVTKTVHDTVRVVVHDTVKVTVPTDTVPKDTIKTPPPPPPPPPPPDTGKKALVLAFAGPTIPPSAIPSPYAFYEKNWKQYADQQWTDFGAKPDAGNSISGYERAAIYYVWWARTGDATYLDRAHQIAVAYRNWIEAAGWAASPHWSQMESMYLDCKVANDAKSCQAVSEVANRLGEGFPPSTYFEVSQGEGRIEARVLISLWMAEKVEGKPRASLDGAILKVLNSMNANGYTPFQSTCGGSLNYMNGMLFDVLTRIHDQRPNAIYNTLIEQKAKAFATWAWNTQWRGALSSGPDDQSFNYVSVYCDGTGSQTGAPDLNGLMLPVFGWLGKTTGDRTWFDKGDKVLAGMQGASVYLYRQFSESYSSSHRYLGYRWGAP